MQTQWGFATSMSLPGTWGCLFRSWNCENDGRSESESNCQLPKVARWWQQETGAWVENLKAAPIFLMSKRGHVRGESDRDSTVNVTLQLLHLHWCEGHPIDVLSYNVVKNGLRDLWFHEQAHLQIPSRAICAHGAGLSNLREFLFLQQSLIFFVTTKADGLICINM